MRKSEGLVVDKMLFAGKRRLARLEEALRDPQADLEAVKIPRFLGNKAATMKVADAFRDRNETALTDYLTGLKNRRAFSQDLDRELGMYSRDIRRNVTLLIVDLDRLKKINDTHGHDAGDVAIKAAAQVLTNSVRGTDTVYRLAGDEFVVILPATDSEAASEAVAKIRERIDEALKTNKVKLPNGKRISIAMSIGTASTDNLLRVSAEELLVLADKYLYLEKQFKGSLTIQ